MQKRSQTGLSIIFLVICIIACITTVVAFQSIPSISSEPNMLLPLSVGLDILLITLYAMYVKHYISVSDDESQIERQAYTDAMTQVHNRAAFNLAAEQLGASASPKLTLIMADLNNLKQVNDTLGHMMGDKLICSLVNCLKQAFGSLGKIYRYGGDEFIILIEKADLEEVQAARTRFEQMILEHSMHGGLEIFVAVGLASRQNPQNATLHVMELLILADNAMYQYKAAQKAARAAYEPARHPILEQIDPTTGILSFPAFKTRLYSVLHSDTPVCPCIINFSINFFDSYSFSIGWSAGNQLLQQLTEFAMCLCEGKGFCAHAEGDSFWIYGDYPNISALTDRISQETNRLQAQMSDFVLYPSFGIYLISDRLTPVSDMCSRASNARISIKGQLDTLYHVYSPEDQQRHISNMRLASSLQRGLKSEEFLPYYQPRYSSDRSRIVGAEAVIRWLQPNQSLSHDDIMELAEKSGLILSLDWYMIRKICQFLKKQLEAGHRCLPVSVNFSRLHVYETDCVGRLCRLADEYDIPYELLDIEIARTSLDHNSLDLLPTLVSDIRKKGFSVQLNGINSYLMTLIPQHQVLVDAIIIDRTLIEVSDASNTNHTILSHAVTLCRELNTLTIVKGVETHEQLELLQRCSCEIVQGDVLSPALSGKDFAQLISRTHSGTPASVITKRAKK
ncbi:MAG: bifunctional diguanylate cyclase/phosphodiesterase [Clostridia bacterium]|nr:bifunctional diguanylate cyclase/phosphodiesterase [Clostridia bacterium]